MLDKENFSGVFLCTLHLQHGRRGGEGDGRKNEHLINVQEHERTLWPSSGAKDGKETSSTLKMEALIIKTSFQAL